MPQVTELVLPSSQDCRVQQSSKQSSPSSTPVSSSASVPRRAAAWLRGVIKHSRIDHATNIRRDPTTIQALLLGGRQAVLAIHSCQDERRKDQWSITAVRCGLSLAETSTPEDARLVAESLQSDSACVEALRNRYSKEVILALPPWVRPWAKVVLEQLAWVDPEPFRQWAKEFPVEAEQQARQLSYTNGGPQ